MFALPSPHAYQAGDKVRVRLHRDDVRFVAGVIVEVIVDKGLHSCRVATRDALVTVRTHPHWLRKLSLVSTRSVRMHEPRGAA